MNPRTTGILLLVALALGAFVWFYEIEGEEAREEAKAAEKRIFPELESGAITRIALTTRDGVEAVLERGEKGWSLVAPLGFPADAFAADGLATNLADLKSETVLENPVGPEEYGLAEGAKVLRFRAGETEHTLRIGNKTPVGSNTYLTVEGRDDVFTVPTFQTTSFDKSLTDLRERSILELDPASIERVEASWPGGGVVLVREAAPASDDEGEAEEGAGAGEAGSGWRLVSPLEGRADDGAVDALLSDLAFLRADGFVDDPDPELLAAFDEPAFDVVLHGKADEAGSAPTWRLRVGPVHEGDERLVRTDREGSLYTVPAARLEDFPREVVDYRFKRLADFSIGDAQQVDLFFHPPTGDPVAVTATRGEDGWSASPERLAPGVVARLVSELSSLEAVDVAAENASQEQLEKAGLSPPTTIITVFGSAPEGEEEGEAAPLPVLAEIQLGRVEGSEYIEARAAGDPALYHLGYELAEHVPVSLDAFRNRFLAAEEPAAPAPPPSGGVEPEFLSPSEESP